MFKTLHNIEGVTLLKIAIDLEIETPDFIPSIPTFRHKLKSDYSTASKTFEKAFKMIEEQPETAIGLANSALESIIKEILNDERVNIKRKGKETLYDLVQLLLTEFKLFPKSDLPLQIKTMGSSLLAVNKSIESLRSENTDFHGKLKDDYMINEPLYAYFIFNSVCTVGLFFINFYQKKYPIINFNEFNDTSDDLPF